MAITESNPLDEEVHEVTETGEKFIALVERLSHQSVIKNYDAYADIAWDAPEMQLRRDDPRLGLTATDPLAETAWYKSQPVEVQTAIGLSRVATAMKLGLQFENVLKRGLLIYAYQLKNNDPKFRYVYHEVIEEAHHGLMFQEFVNRSGIDVKGIPFPRSIGAELVPLLGRIFPELFFFFVLGGEDPIDFVQRRTLRSDKELHPLVEQIMRHHVTEEARHLSFARHYLKLRVPRLGRVRRAVLSVAIPIILGQMTDLMLKPSNKTIKAHRIPPEVMAEAYPANVELDDTTDSLVKVRRLAAELDLINPASKRIWKAYGIWREAAASG